MYRFHPQHHKVRELLDAGGIGDVVSMHARFHFNMDRTPGEVRLQPNLEELFTARQPPRLITSL